MDGLTNRLHHDIDALLERDPVRWSDYVARPSTLFTVGRAEFAEPYTELIAQEQQHLRHTMNEDGSWDLPWRWKEYPQEWPIAENWWKAIRARHLLKFLALQAESSEMLYAQPRAEPPPWPGHPGGPTYTDADADRLLDEIHGDH